MTITEMISIAAAAAAAGAINAVAGGGTIITFPVLLFFGTPPVIANATSTLALVIGTAGSIFGYRKHIAEVKHWLSRFVPVSVIGGFLGGILLTHTSNETFAKMVPFLILFATILFFAQGAFRRFAGFDGNAGSKHHAVLGAIFFQFAVSLYGGYFGAGIGILMLASLGFIGLTNIYEMNGLKTVLGSLINLVATLVFVFKGLIHWPKALIMAGGAVCGYYLASHYSQRIPQKYVRHLITIIGLLISIWTFYEQFFR